MQKVFTNELPHRGKTNQINWKESIGCKVKFIYDNIQGELEIIDYYKKNKKYYLNIKYGNKIFYIDPNEFKQCKIGNKLGKINHNYKYNIGDVIINVKSGKLKILEQIKIKNTRKENQKGYRYKCLICGNKDIITEAHLAQYRGCNVCSNENIKIGINDMWTTNPNLAKLLADPNDGYKYMKNSGKYVDWICPECNNIIKNKEIQLINKKGLSCPKCSDKLPYTEKFVFNVLQQLLNNNFIYQLSKTTFKWCKNYKYDFYFEINNERYITETNGLQHYQENSSFQSCGGRSLQEEQKNDKLKKELALQNGIKEENYIVIDCRYSTLDWIKKHTLSSKLNKLFNLSKIDWLDCHEYACNSLVKKVCELWNKKTKDSKEIANIMKLSRNTIIKYLKQGVKLGWCDYIPKKSLKYDEYLKQQSQQDQKAI